MTSEDDAAEKSTPTFPAIYHGACISAGRLAAQCAHTTYKFILAVAGCDAQYWATGTKVNNAAHADIYCREYFHILAPDHA